MRNTKIWMWVKYNRQQMIMLCSIVLLVLLALTSHNTILPTPRLSATTVIAHEIHSISAPRATQIPATRGSSNHYTIRKTNKAKLQIKAPTEPAIAKHAKAERLYVVSNITIDKIVVARPGYYLFLFRYTPF